MKIEDVIKASLDHETERKLETGTKLPHFEDAVAILRVTEENPSLAICAISSLLDRYPSDDILMERETDEESLNEMGFKFRTTGECAAFKQGVEYAQNPRRRSPASSTLHSQVTVRAISS